MAVHRLGTSKATTTEELGSVLVTIDDLHALRELLAKQRPKHILPLVEFSGGSFDDDEDMRSLTDVELSTLTLKTEVVEVTLSADRADATGDERAASDVYTNWARSRQIKPRWRRRKSTASSIVLIVLALLSAIYVYSGLLEIKIPAVQAIFGEAPKSRLALWIFLIFSLMVVAYGLRAAFRRPWRGAYIKPVTLEQYRADRETGKRHWQVAAISLAGLCVALLAVIVTLISK